MNSEKVDFDSFATNYDQALESALSVTGEGKNYFASRRSEITAAVLSGLHISPLRLLDFGCGTGSATPFLFEQLPIKELVGTDPSQASMNVAIAEWTKFAATFVPLEAVADQPKFDLAFCNGVFHHIAPAERPASLALVRNALTADGYFALWENNPWNPGTRWVMSRCEFDRDAVTITPPEGKKLLQDAGFRVVSVTSHFYFPSSLRVLRPLEPWLSKLPLGGQYLLLAQRT